METIIESSRNKETNQNTMNMNELVKQSYDKFENVTTTKTVNASNRIGLRHVSSPVQEATFLDLEFHQVDGPPPHLENGEIILLLNDTKRYSLKPNVSMPPTFSKDEYIDIFGHLAERIYWDEYIYYEISEELLREMAYATDIKIKLIGASVSMVLQDSPKQPSFKMLAKALYNAIYDSSIFNDEIQKECQRLSEEDIKSKMNKIARETDDADFDEEDEEDLEVDEYEEDIDENNEDIKTEASEREEHRSEKEQQIIKEAEKRLGKEERSKIQEEWKSLRKKCRKNNDSMEHFIGNGCDWDTNVKEFIEEFGQRNNEELYRHLVFSIPLYERLLEHMHTYNSKHPQNKVSVDSASEAEVRKFVNVLKRSRDKIYPSIVAHSRKATMKKILVGVSIVFWIIMIIVLCSI